MLLARALVVLAAVAGALLVWVIADPLFKADLDVRFGDSGAADHVAARAVATTTLVLALIVRPAMIGPSSDRSIATTAIATQMSSPRGEP